MENTIPPEDLEEMQMLEQFVRDVHVPVPQELPLYALPDQLYLEKTILPLLLRGLEELVVARPPDALAFLAAYLMGNNPTRNSDGIATHPPPSPPPPASGTPQTPLPTATPSNSRGKDKDADKDADKDPLTAALPPKIPMPSRQELSALAASRFLQGRVVPVEAEAVPQQTAEASPASASPPPTSGSPSKRAAA